ncbi:MAG: type IV toxin-antitoxin system AbiEi family antitoxin domain-containing protein [bacterium]
MYLSDESAIRIFSEQGGILSLNRARELGISKYRLYDMLHRKLLERLSRGVYRLSELPPLGNPDLVTVALRAPNAVVCLVSALAFHGMTDEIPHRVHLAIRSTDRKPKLEYPPAIVYRFSTASHAAGVETHDMDGTAVRIYSIHKTIADCFKFRRRIGEDIAIAALREYRRSRSYKPVELIRYCRICRVERIVRTYLEAIS